MTRNAIVGWETNDLFAETGATATGSALSLESTIVRTGSKSLKMAAVSGASSQLGSVFGPARGFYRMYLRVTARPASLARQIHGDSGTVNLLLNADGTITYRNTTTVIGTSSTALTDTSRWYRVEWRHLNGTSVPVLRIDGVDQVTGSPSTWSISTAIGPADTVADTYTAYVDDVASDDTDWVGPGSVVLLKPISDNARATLWTGGTGGTTSLFDAVDNTPPTGTATETNTTQIEHAGGAAGTTDAYDANMTSYSTAGVGAGDTINALLYFIIHGEDVATGTKLLNFSLVSNPTQASGIANFSAGADVGALGTYPTNWTRTANTFISSPSVTVGTSPVMRVVRPETASRVASVCFMGMYVDYTPAVVASLVIPHRHRGLIVR